MAVRVEQEGVIQRDYHTAGKGGFLRASGTVERSNVVVSTRYCSSDARLLVGLAGKDFDLLARAHAALRDPHWPLYPGSPSGSTMGCIATRGLRTPSPAIPGWAPIQGGAHSGCG